MVNNGDKTHHLLSESFTVFLKLISCLAFHKFLPRILPQKVKYTTGKVPL